MTIVDRIFSLMKDSSISQVQLAHIVGISQSTITSWKQRGSVPSANVIEPIAKALNVSCEYIITGKESAESNLSEEAIQIAQRWDELNDDWKIIVKGKVYEAYKMSQLELNSCEAKTS